MLIALRNNIPYNLVSPGAWSRELEIAAVEIELINTKKTLICVCYRPPCVDINEWLCLFTSFLESSSTYESILICGDFNFPDLYWNSDFVFQFQDISSGSTDFRELISDFFLQQINIHPTRKNNILDLVFTRSPETVRNLECVQPTQLNLFSDHSLLFFDFNIHAKLSACDIRTVYNYRLADWNGLSETLRLTDLMPSINSTDIDSDWQQWMDLFLGAVADHIPVKTFKRKNTPPWLDNEIKHLLKKKETARRKAKKSGKLNIHEKFRALRRQAKKLIAEKRKEWFQGLPNLLKSNSKKFWSSFKSSTK